MTKIEDQVDAHVERLVNANLLKMSPYKVADSTGLLKLDAMENPFVWPEALQAQWLESLKSISVNRYPDTSATELVLRIRDKYQISDDCDVLLGNGSDELIQLIAMAVSQSGRPILAPEPSFVMYAMIAQFTGMDYVGVPLTADFELDLERMLKAIEAENPSVIFLAQPNNPTGNLWGDEKLKRIIEAANGLVVIDEAYIAFTDADYLHWLDEYPNLVVMRTFSKVGLAGLRLGMLFGHRGWIEQINKLRLPYNINSLTQHAASFALDHFDVFENQTQELCRQRKQLLQSLGNLPLVKVFPSQANFITVQLAKGDAERVHNALKEQGVLVKKLDGGHELLADCLRITVSTSDENKQLLDALAVSLS